MRPVVKLVAALLLCVLIMSGAVQAQPSVELPSVANGRLNEPRHGVDTAFALYDADLADELGPSLRRMRRAAAECKFADWSREFRLWLKATDKKKREADALEPGESRDPMVRGKAMEDYKTVADYRRSSPEFPAFTHSCPPTWSARPPLGGEVLPAVGMDKMGFPEKRIADTPIAVFDEAFARSLGDIFAAMRQAVKTCNRAAFEHGVGLLSNALQSRADQIAAGDGRNPIARGQAAHDVDLAETFMRENWIRFLPCNPNTR